MKKKIGDDDEQKFGDFPYFDRSIRSDPSFSHSRPGTPSTILTTCSSPQVGTCRQAWVAGQVFDLDASTGHQVPAGITYRSEELLAGTW